MNNQAKGFLVLLLGLLLFSFKKKPVGTVEVGQGEFGEFGTEGVWPEDMANEPVQSSTKTPGYVPGYGTKNLVNGSPVKNVTVENLRPYIHLDNDSTAQPCCK